MSDMEQARSQHNRAFRDEGSRRVGCGRRRDPIPPRGWLLGNTFCRRFISTLVAGGGTGKSAVRTAQALALATGRPLTGEHVYQRCRVLLVSLEDDRDELRRRVRAAQIHRGISDSEIRGWLFLATPAGLGWKLAEAKDGRVEPGELGVKLRETIDRRRIDVVILDPFVKTHAVEENANGPIDIVVGLLAQIASECNCAIDAPHHVAKGAGEPGNSDRGRGASSFRDAARLVYTLNTMSEADAKNFGIEEAERRLLVRMDSAKVNIAPPAHDAAWFRLVGVGLGNGNDTYPHGDQVHTIEPWTPPRTWEGLSYHTLNDILTAIDAGLPDGNRYSDRGAARNRAAWPVVRWHAPEKTEGQCREIIRTWVKNGVLVVEEYQDPVRREVAKGLQGRQRQEAIMMRPNSRISFGHQSGKVAARMIPAPLGKRHSG